MTKHVKHLFLLDVQPGMVVLVVFLKYLFVDDIIIGVVVVAEDEGEGMLGIRQSSLNTAMDCKMIKANKKKPGLLKGIGSMFR